MINPFRQRATEYHRDPAAFLSIVSPEPVSFFLGPDGKAGRLYDRLVLLQGTPGSGKTTLARLMDLAVLQAVVRNSDMPQQPQLIDALTDIMALKDGKPAVLATRIALETDYREFWEFPYPEDVKHGLMTSLIQARAMLGWIRSLTDAGNALESICIEPFGSAGAAVDAIGGTGAVGLHVKARAIESAVYGVISALVPPPLLSLDREATSGYRPFDVLGQFVVQGTSAALGSLLPLAVLDDAHSLHSSQFQTLVRWLSRRETRVARWVLTRLDILSPDEVLSAPTDAPLESPLPGLNPEREITIIRLQGRKGDRRRERSAFRRMAREMADRYLGQMQLFRSRRIQRFVSLMETEPPSLSPTVVNGYEKSTDSAAREMHISDDRMASLRALAAKYAPNQQPLTSDVRAAVVRLLLHRYVKRTQHTRSLFGDTDPEPVRPIEVDASIVDAARLQLMHQFGRPFYFGMDDICDAASENAEQFLRLAAELVDASSTQIIRNREAALDPRRQHQLLREVADRVMRVDWNFPYANLVRRLIENIAARCVEISLAPNAPLGPGASAYGIPQQEVTTLPDRYPDLAKAIQFGVAYNAIVLVPRYDCQGEEWCLLELGGIPLLHYGLTLKRGGFVEGTSSQLAGFIREDV